MQITGQRRLVNRIYSAGSLLRVIENHLFPLQLLSIARDGSDYLRNSALR